MTLASSSKIVISFIGLILLIAGCERDEPEVLPRLSFKLNVSDNFLRNRFQTVAIISDFHGNVLAIGKLNHAGIHEFEFPQEKDHTYHLTLFDGNVSFTTYSSLSPATTYSLDVNETKYPGNAGTHSVFTQGHHLQPSGKNVSFYHNKANDMIELWLTKDSSDLFIYVEPFPSDGPRYTYLPVIKKSESTTIDINSLHKSFNLVPAALVNNSGTNIFLYGDTVLTEQKMQYFFSRSGPYTAGTHNMYVPPLNDGPKISYYRTVFSSFDGHTYTSTDKNIATQQKQLTTTVSRPIETDPLSVFYSIESDATIIEWSASGTNIHWRILSQPGINMKINFPQLPQSFRNGYTLGDQRTLKFSSATLTKDSRFPSYFETVTRYYLRDQKNLSTPHEKIQQTISIP